MAEVGLMLFAKTALEVIQEVLPAYSGKFSKHTFTQKQLMTILCLMRFEDWTSARPKSGSPSTVTCVARSALARAGSHDTLPLHAPRDRRDLDTVLIAIVGRLTPRRRGRKRKKAVVAVDATGLAPGSITTFFINRRTDRGEGLPWKH